MEKPARAPRRELIRLREAAGLTQKQLATAVGLQSDRAVRAWENGDYAPSMILAVPLSRALGVPVQDVVEAVVGLDPGLAETPPKGKVRQVQATAETSAVTPGRLASLG